MNTTINNQNVRHLQNPNYSLNSIEICEMLYYEVYRGIILKNCSHNVRYQFLVSINKFIRMSSPWLHILINNEARYLEGLRTVKYIHWILKRVAYHVVVVISTVQQTEGKKNRQEVTCPINEISCEAGTRLWKISP